MAKFHEFSCNSQKNDHMTILLLSAEKLPTSVEIKSLFSKIGHQMAEILMLKAVKK